MVGRASAFGQYFFYGNDLSNHVQYVGQVLLTTGFILVMAAIGFTAQVQKVMPTDLTEGLNQIERSHNDLARSSSGYLGEVKFSSPEEAVQFLPVGLLYFLTVPWPSV